MNKIKKYRIIYNKIGGKPFDYFFYRFINSFISNKKTVLSIVNSFPEGIKQSNYSKLKLLLNENKVSDITIDVMMKLLDKIDKLDFIFPINYASIFLSTFDKLSFNIQKTILNEVEIREKIDIIPNIRLQTPYNFSNYIKYILNHRYHNYFDADLRRFINDFITNQIYSSSSNITKLKIDNIKLDEHIQNIYRDYKGIIKFESNIKNELEKNLQIKGILNKNIVRHSTSNDPKKYYKFTFIDSIDVEILNSLFNETNTAFIIYPIVPSSNINFYHILLDKIESTYISFYFKNEIITQSGPMSIYFISNKSKNVLITNIKNIKQKIKVIQIKESNIKTNTKFIPFIKKYQIDTKEYSYYDINYLIKKETLKYGRKSHIKGESYEKQVLFSSVLKICLDNPDININNIRIYSGVKVSFITAVKKYQVGELDILIVNEEQEIVAIGEIKSSIDSIQTAYKQLIKFQEVFKQIENLQFIKSNKEEISLGISAELIQAISENINPEDIKYFYIITQNQELGEFNPGHSTEFLTKLNKNNILKLDHGKFIINPEVDEQILSDLSIDENRYLEENEIELTSEILRKYLGKNNMIIFKNNEKLLNTIDLLEHIIPNIE